MDRNPFDAEDIEDLRALIQIIRDWRAWDKLRKYIASSIKIIASISAFLLLAKDPLIKWLGYIE